MIKIDFRITSFIESGKVAVVKIEEDHFMVACAQELSIKDQVGHVYMFLEREAAKV